MKNIASGLTQILIQNAPKICIYLGLGGLIKATVDSGIKAAQVKEKIDKFKKENNVEKISPADYIKLTWKDYAPIALEAAMSACLIVAGDTAHTHRTAALATAYSISASSLAEYKSRVNEVISEDKLKEIEEKITKANNDKAKIVTQNNPEAVVFSEGECWVIDDITKLKFKSSWNKIQEVCNNLVSNALGDVTPIVTLSDFLYELGISCDNIPEYASRVGWPIYKGSNHRLKIYPSTVLSINNQPCLSILYENEPEPIL